MWIARIVARAVTEVARILRYRDLSEKLVTRRELAEKHSVHMQTITKWEREGMPVAERGPKGATVADVRAWLKARALAQNYDYFF